MKSKRTEKQKIAFSLYSELKDIWEQKSKLGRFKLKVPIQNGWRKEWRVRGDVMRSSEGSNYLKILPLVKNSVYSRTTLFSDDNKLGLKGVSERYIENNPKVLPEFFWSKYFDLQTDFHSFYKTGVEVIYRKFYHVKRQSAFETIIVPNFIDSLPIISPELDSRQQEIQNKIEKLKLWPIIDKLLGLYGSCRCEYCLSEEKQKHVLIEIEKEIRQELAGA